MKKNKKYILGVDVGATTVKTGVVTVFGKLIYRDFLVTKKFKTKNLFIQALALHLKEIIDKSSLQLNDIKAIGIGLPGRVDFEKGIVHDLTNIKGWKEVKLSSILGKKLNLPVFLDNDANAFAESQLIWGAAKGAKNAVCVTLGTGVGGGIIINSKVYRGSNFSAGEIGHMCIDVNSKVKCGCGSFGCLEAFVGNGYIVKRAINKIKKGSKTILTEMAGNKNLKSITPEMITKAAERKDKLSLQIWKETGTFLGAGLSGLINVINPDSIVIGGGVAKAWKFIYKPIKDEITKRAMRQHVKILKIVKAEFIDEAGIVGAASLAMET